MHAIEPARLKPGVTVRTLPADPAIDDAAEDRGARRRLITGPRARLLGSEEPAGDEVRQEARRHRHRSDHAGHRLRLGEPRHARRALEGRLVPLPDAGFPRARAPRRELRHRRRPLRDRIVARDEPGRPQGRRRGSRAADGHRLRPEHGRHLPPQQLQPRPARRAEPGSGRRRAGRRRVHASIRVSRQLRNVTQGKTYEPVPLSPEGRRDSPERRHLRGRPARVPAVGASRARRSTGPSRTPPRR